MKVQIYVMLSALTVSALGQCAKPEMNPVWNSSKQQFSCVAPSGSAGISHDDTVSPKGNKEFCSTARENLLKACPASGEGKPCKSKAKSIFNACYKDFKDQSESQAGSAGTTNQAAKTDRAVCMQTFSQKQQACQGRKLHLPPDNRMFLRLVCKTLSRHKIHASQIAVKGPVRVVHPSRSSVAFAKRLWVALKRKEASQA